MTRTVIASAIKVLSYKPQSTTFFWQKLCNSPQQNILDVISTGNPTRERTGGLLATMTIEPKDVVQVLKNLEINVTEEDTNKTTLSSSSTITTELREKWAAMQEELRSQVISEDRDDWGEGLKNLKLVAGLDISYPKDEEDASLAVACLVIISYPSLELVHKVAKVIKLQEPYIPGFLAFRESQPLLTLLNDVIKSEPALKPDVIMVDGNGTLHPRRYGCACHIGLTSNIPTVGVAKNIYKMESIEFNKAEANMKNLGDSIILKDDKGVLGLALKTAEKAKNPVYVSVGHKLSLETAKQIVLGCSKFRVPEPIRFADFHSREFLRSDFKSCKE